MGEEEESLDFLDRNLNHNFFLAPLSFGASTVGAKHKMISVEDELS